MGGCLHQAVIISDDDELNSAPAREQCAEAKWCFLKENSKNFGTTGDKKFDAVFNSSFNFIDLVY